MRRSENGETGNMQRFWPLHKNGYSAFRQLAIAVGVIAVLVPFASNRRDAVAQSGLNQTGAADPVASGTATLQVYSRLTVVDVTATDASGQPVQGLQRSDFSILEDGKPQPIRNFEEVSSHLVEPPPELPPNVYTNLTPPAPSSAVNIILLDLANEAPVDDTSVRQISESTLMQHNVKVAAIQAVQNMPTGTQIAVIAMTNNLRIVQGFTSDRALLTAAIQAVPYDLLGMSTSNGSQGTGNGNQGLGNGNQGSGNGSGQCVQMNIRNESVLESLDRIAVDSMTIHGRKNLIWFTVGVPAIADPGLEASCLPDYQRELSNAYALLTAAQVSIYPIDATTQLSVHEFNTNGAGPLGTSQLAEQMVAEATGGVASWGSNDMTSPVLSAIENGANYYSIAFVPPDAKYDGAHHTIDVKVDRPGVHLIFRNGYYSEDTKKMKMPPGLSLSMSPPPAKDGDMKAAMSRGMETSQQIVFDVGVEPSTQPPPPGSPVILGTLNPKLRNKRLTRYGFNYSVPGQQIAFKDGKKGTHNGALDFDIAVYDSNDRLLTGLSQIVKMTLTDDSYRKMIASNEPIRLSQQIDLPPGQLFLRVGVLDHTSDKTGTLEIPLTVGKR